jgi:hypothetical protein
VEAESQLPAGAVIVPVLPAAGRVFRRRVDLLCRERFFSGPAGDEDRGGICVGNGQEDVFSPGLLEQVIQNVFGNGPVGLLESLQEYILRGSAGWC